MHKIIPLMQKVNHRVKIPLLSYFANKKTNTKRIIQAAGVCGAIIMLGFAMHGETVLGALLFFILSFFIGWTFLFTGINNFFKYTQILKSDVFSLEEILKDGNYQKLKKSVQNLEQDEIDELFNIEFSEDDLAYISQCITNNAMITHDDLYYLYNKYMVKHAKTLNFNAFADQYNLHAKQSDKQQQNVAAVEKFALPGIEHTKTFNSRNTL